MRATIAFNRRLSAAYLHLGVSAPGFPKEFRAGQFVMVRPPWVGDPFLPRPFSIYRLSAGRAAETHLGEAIPIVEVLYKVVGKGTQYLARLEPGQAVELLGPLGNGFAPPARGESAVLVAGGIGVPPIAAVAREIRNSKFEIRSVHVFLGGKTAEDILCLKDFEEAGTSGVHVTTEDGSLGTRGLITDLLAPFLASWLGTGAAALGPPGSREGADRRNTGSPDSPPAIRLYTCGPPGMLAAVACLAEACRVPCQVSVEANMACGFGACMGCAVERRGEERSYRLVCKDGPVFDSRELVW